MAEITANIGANIDPLERGLNRAQSLLRRFGRQFQQLARRVAQFTTGIAAAGAALGSVLVKKSLASIDSMAKLARQLGTTTESLGVMERAAVLSGTSLSELQRPAIRMNQVLGEAARGAGTGAKALELLNLRAEDLMALPFDKRLQVIAQRMQEMNLNAQQQSDIMAQLGDSRGRLFNLMEDGAAVLQRATREATAFGLAVSDVDAAQIEAANDALSTIGAVITGIGNRIAVFLAPLLEKIGTSFATAAVESEGFRAQIEASFTFMTRAAGFVADAVHLITAGLKTVNVGVNMVGNAFIQAAASIERGFREALDGSIQKVNNLIAALNLVPGVEIDPVADLTDRGFGQGIQRFAAESRRLVAESRLDLMQTLNEPLPSDSIKAWLAEVDRASQEATRRVVDSRQTMVAASMEIDNEQEAREREKAERDLERQKQKLDVFTLALLTEEEVERESHKRRLEELALFHEQRLIEDQEAAELRARLVEQHEARIADIKNRESQRAADFAEMTEREKTATVLSEGRKLLAGVASQNKTLFNLNKAAAIAETVVQGLVGAERTWAAYPYPWNIPMTALHVAGTAARLASLASQGFSGGESGGGGGGAAATGGAAVPAAAAAPSRVANINLQGDTFGRQGVRDLIEAINEELDDGAILRVS